MKRILKPVFSYFQPIFCKKKLHFCTQMHVTSRAHRNCRRSSSDNLACFRILSLVILGARKALFTRILKPGMDGSRPFTPFFGNTERTEMTWHCLLCSSFLALWLVSLLTHYNSNHSHEDRHFTIRCDIKGCTKEYCKVNSFTKHVRSVHSRFLHCSTNETRGEPVLLKGKLWIMLYNYSILITFI